MTMDSFELLLLAFKGVAIASLPIAAVYVGRASNKRGDRLTRLAWVTAFLTFDLIVFGAFTRLTDSGLGCPDWPGCYAKANPFLAGRDIRDAEAAMPFGPVSMSKAWIEMIHRYLAMAVGALIVSMLAISVARVGRERGRAVRDGPAPVAEPAFAAGLLALVVVQGAFGAWTVTQKLQPLFVTTHLLLGMTLLAGLVLHALMLERHAISHRSVSRPAAASPSGVRVVAMLALVVLACQIALGGWVSANYAVLACNDFPTCQGVWIPSMDFPGGFHPWRELGRTADGSYLSVAALTAIHWTHRCFAAAVLVVTGVLVVKLRQTAGLSRCAVALSALVLAQCLTGVVNVVFDWPLVAAVIHNAGAAALVTTLVVINYRLLRGLRSAPARDFAMTARSLPTLGG